MAPRKQFDPKRDKPAEIWPNVKRILGYFKKQAWLLAIVFVLIIISSLSYVYAISLQSVIIDDCIKPMIGQGINAETLKPLTSTLIKLGLFYICSAVTSWGYSRIMVNVTNKLLNSIRNDLFGKMSYLPLVYFDTHTHGELMALYTSDIGAINQAVSEGLVTVISNGITIAGCIIMMIIYSPILVSTIFVIMGLMSLVTKFISKKSLTNFTVNQDAIAKLNGFMEESMSGQKVVKVFTHEQQTKDEFDQINEVARKASTTANIYSGMMGPIMNNLGHINYALSASLGAVLVINGKISIGKLGSYLSYTKNTTSPLQQMMQLFNSLMRAVAGAERIFKVIDMTPEVDEGKVTLVYATYNDDNQLIESENRTGLWAWKVPKEDGYEYVRLKGDIKFDNVTFGYNEKKTVLHNVSFYAKPGQKIAFVGATGAGKTTITNLINRFYDINEGIITYDGINVLNIKKDSLRSSLAMVLQDTHLFTGTVKENIRYGKLDATDEEIVAAAKLANADEFIRMLPEGYDTVLTQDGANLSQGQRQLLNIARAAVADAPVLILDEATSSIDTRTESLIEQGMDNIMCGRTVFVIAHRLSTVRNSNAIMVLDQGKIIERGDHDDLLAQKGKYYMLYTGQFELD